MQTTTSIKAGNAPDLFSGIPEFFVRNEEKITEQDRLYCQSQQDLLYKTLNQIEKWYAIFKEDAEQYRKERQFKYEDNGRCRSATFISTTGRMIIRTMSSNRSTSLTTLWTRATMPMRTLPTASFPISTRPTMWMSLSRKLTDRHCLWDSDRSTRPMWILSSNIWGGKSFRETAEEELLARFLKTVQYPHVGARSNPS